MDIYRLDALSDKVKALQLDGVEASEATIKDGSYTLQRPFVMATKGEVSEQSKKECKQYLNILIVMLVKKLSNKLVPVSAK